MGQQIVSYFAGGLGQIVAFVPNLVSAIIVLAVGYLVARVLGSLTRRILARTRFDPFVAKRLRPRASTRERAASAATGSLVFWLGMLVTVSIAARSLRLTSLSYGIDRIIGYVPRVFVAALIVGIAIALANVVADLIGDATHTWLARGARVALIALASFMALDELGIARSIVMMLFAAVVGAAAVAAAIAFGIGNIDFAKDTTRRAQHRVEREAPDALGERPMAPPRAPTDEPGAHTH